MIEGVRLDSGCRKKVMEPQVQNLTALSNGVDCTGRYVCDVHPPEKRLSPLIAGYWSLGTAIAQGC